jgi:hypothetical protein
MYSAYDHLAVGLPHSEIHGSKSARLSPRLFAACYVLHRLLVPRHPPNALQRLISTFPSDHPPAEADEQPYLFVLESLGSLREHARIHRAAISRSQRAERAILLQTLRRFAKPAAVMPGQRPCITPRRFDA